MSASTESQCEADKECRVCERSLPVSQFHAHKGTPSGVQSMCKECTSEYQRQYYQEKLAQRTGAPCDELEPAPVEEAPVKRPRLEPEDLYVMAISTDPTGAMHGLKVGRSGNVQQRASALSESMPFNVKVLATFNGAGHLEKRVHKMLEETRNTTGRGREWFHASLPHVLHTVALCVQDQGEMHG